MASCSSCKPHPRAFRTPGVTRTRNSSFFFWPKHARASVCLMRQTGEQRFRSKRPCQIQFAELTFTAQLTINICPLGFWSFKHYPYNIIII